MPKQICTSCNSTTVEGIRKGNGWIEFVLWLAYIVPGIIYSIWRRSGEPSSCPTCKKESLKPFVLVDDEETVDCEWCAESIKPKAKICKHCGKDVIPKPKETAWYDDNELNPEINNTSASIDMEKAWKASTHSSKLDFDSPVSVFLRRIIGSMGGGLLIILCVGAIAAITNKTENLNTKQSSINSFYKEYKLVSRKINCPNPKVIKSTANWEGDLFSCVSGKAETVKLYINEKPSGNEVKNIKLMWNDWTKNMGYGVHTDKGLAANWVAKIADLYAPQKASEVKRMFLNRSNKTITSNNYQLKYTHDVGPAINEHLLVITAK